METLRGIVGYCALFFRACAFGIINREMIQKEQAEFDAYADSHRNLPIPEKNRLKGVPA